MNPLEITKEIIDIAKTAGIKKDILELQAAKIGLLSDEIVRLDKLVSKLEVENQLLKEKLEKI